MEEFIRRPKKHSEPLWLVAYLDLMTNLLAMFIFLVSISVISQSKYESSTKGIVDHKSETLDELKAKIDTAIEQNHLQDLVKTSLGFDGLRVIFTSSSLFDSGSDRIEMKSILRTDPILNEIIKADPRYQINLEGYSDDVALKTGGSSKFHDNWGLSSARGVALLNVLQKKGITSSRMSVAGFADTKPSIPTVGKQGKALEEARAANRRVVIRVYL